MPRLVRKSSNPEADPTADFLPTTIRVASVAAEHKATDIIAYDVRGLTVIADSFVLCSVASEPQMKAVFNAVRREMKAIGVRPLHAVGKASDAWVVLDFGAVVFHAFREEARKYYDLDGLWGDAPQFDLGLDEDH